jgi:hypothetical protein
MRQTQSIEGAILRMKPPAASTRVRVRGPCVETPWSTNERQRPTMRQPRLTLGTTENINVFFRVELTFALHDSRRRHTEHTEQYNHHHEELHERLRQRSLFAGWHRDMIARAPVGDHCSGHRHCYRPFCFVLCYCDGKWRQKRRLQ